MSRKSVKFSYNVYELLVSDRIWKSRNARVNLKGSQVFMVGTIKICHDCNRCWKLEFKSCLTWVSNWFHSWSQSICVLIKYFCWFLFNVGHWKDFILNCGLFSTIQLLKIAEILNLLSNWFCITIATRPWGKPPGEKTL